MATNAAEGESSTPSGITGGGPSSSSARVRTKPDPFLVVCRCFSFITAFAAILCIAVNILAAVRSFRMELDIFDGIFRCYAVLIAIVVVLAETEWEFMLKFWKVLEYWAGRGMLQIFVAVMTRAYPESAGEKQELILLQKISSYLLLACGFLYVISGILCIGFVKRARMKKEVSRDQAVKDLRELEKRREELEALLIQVHDRA
ncbi:hypothetical protein M9H77_20653 [Catharanthus roseus]|uniref:Uncharacterized protein n=1 Tax=Catharanthus roseus TaxID=4058 RepID=A0ACC0AKC8_CATRO|nr:hypothetical protein M9H77_20653 [Catharanthus roseus]